MQVLQVVAERRDRVHIDVERNDLAVAQRQVEIYGHALRAAVALLTVTLLGAAPRFPRGFHRSRG